MDFLCGDLDRVFTVLYEMGHIEPLFAKDWKILYRETQARWDEVSHVIRDLNNMSNLKEIRDYIATLPQGLIESLVLEVAREMADFHEKSYILH